MSRIANLLVSVAFSWQLVACATVPEPIGEPAEPATDQPPTAEVSLGETSDDVPEEGEAGGIVVEPVGAEGGTPDSSEEGAWQTLERELRQKAEKDPEDGATRKELALVEMRLGNWSEAERNARAAYRLNPKDVVLARMVVLALARANRLQEADAFVTECLSQFPDDVSMRNLQVDVMIARGEYLRAVETSKELLKKDEVNAEVMKNLARAYFYLGKYNTALYVLDRAEGLSKGDYVIEYYRALVTHRQDKPPAAVVAAYNKVLALRPDFAEVHNNLGLVLYSIRDFSRAVSEFKEAIRLQPAFKEARLNLATALRAGGAKEEAEKVYQGLIEEYPNFGEPYYNLALMYFEDEFGGLSKETLLSKAVETFEQFRKVVGQQGKDRATVDGYIAEAKRQISELDKQKEEEIRFKAEQEKKLAEVRPQVDAKLSEMAALRSRLEAGAAAWEKAGDEGKTQLYRDALAEFDDAIGLLLNDLKAALDNKSFDDVNALLGEIDSTLPDIQEFLDAAFENPPPEAAPPEVKEPEVVEPEAVVTPPTEPAPEVLTPYEGEETAGESTLEVEAVPEAAPLDPDSGVPEGEAPPVEPEGGPPVVPD